MRKYFVIFFVCFSVTIQAQNIEIFEFPSEETIHSDSIVYTLVENMPLFHESCLNVKAKKRDNCSRDAWFNYLKKIKSQNNILKKGEKARAYFSFVVEVDGYISSCTLLQSCGNKKLDNIALVHLKKMSRFYQPGYQRGKAVRVKYSFPIDFVG